MINTGKGKIPQEEIIPLKTDVGALGNRINKDTRSLHNKIDKQMTLKFALALRDYKIYRQGLQSFYHVFKAIEKSLERELAKSDDDKITYILRNIWKPAMARSEPAEKDLLFYYDDHKEKFMTPMMSEQIKFSNHIESVTTEKPYLLLAYLHVMYLALFAGGRIMRSSLSKATGMFPQKPGYSHEEIVKMGSNFFTFPVEDEDFFRILYKRDYELFTRNELTEEQKLEIIEESKYIFQQNANCVSELEKHNMARIRQKWSYIAVTKGYYVVMAVTIMMVLFYVRKIFMYLV
ncbi:heme-binding protein Hmx1p [[Candida] jaroonii]|uniref:Heme-binding protein Hmx1p n=1 Tax=[Candida] jaroonii TaxID=467808 RepID=A0ACA9YEI2_9ASCO|nr:heme-binding protein Hmx1p [[Candida] jaroonii]